MNNEYPTVISFYTMSWQYPHYAKKMRHDCDRYDIDHHIVELKDTGSWINNTAIKPRFILDTLKELKRRVLWIDVDGTLYKIPELFNSEFDYDFAAKRKVGAHTDRFWHVGTLYFDYNERTLDFLEAWCELNDSMEGSDELALNELWKANNNSYKDLNYFELPPEYFQMLRADQPDPFNGTVIAHRASTGSNKKQFMEKQRAEASKNPK